MRQIQLKIVLVACLGLFSHGAQAQSGLAEAYCQAYMPMIQQAISFRNQGIPKDVSVRVVNKAYDTNRDLWNWLRDIVDLTYENPKLVAQAYSDGRLYQNCVQTVRGF